MSVAAKLRRAPMRIATGAFILNSGLQKLGGDEDTAKHVHGAASGAYPMIGSVQPKVFMRVLAVAETALGSALLLPIVPAKVAGAGLMSFSGALLGMWWRTPGMHEEGSPRPTQQGTAIAKDSWMFGIGAGLVLDDLLTGASESHLEHKAERRARRQTRKAEAKARKYELKLAAKQRRKELEDAVRDGARSRAKQVQAAAREQAAQARAQAKDQLADVRSAAQERAGGVRGLAKEQAGGVRGFAKEQAGAVRGAAKQAAGSARDAVGAARDAADRASDKASDKASDIAAGVADKAADAADKAGEKLADITG